MCRDGGVIQSLTSFQGDKRHIQTGPLGVVASCCDYRGTKRAFPQRRLITSGQMRVQTDQRRARRQSRRRKREHALMTERQDCDWGGFTLTATTSDLCKVTELKSPGSNLP